MPFHYYGNISSREMSVTGSNTTGGEFSIYDNDNSNRLILKGPGTISSDFTLYMPTGVPATSDAKYLSSDTSGNLSFVNVNELYNSTNKKLETTATGAMVTGIFISNGLVVKDSETLNLGDSSDLIIQHNSVNSSIQNVTGRLEISSTVDASNALVLTSNAGTSETIGIHNIQGTSESSIKLTTNSGGIDIDAATSKNIDISGGQVLITSKDNAASSISLTANQGTSETIVVTNSQGTSESALTFTATAGGIDMDAAASKNIDISGGQVLISSKDDVASAISLTANQGTSETIVVTNTQGTGAGAITLTATAGGITLTGADENKDIYMENSPVKLEKISAPTTTTDKLYNIQGYLKWESSNVQTNTFTSSSTSNLVSNIISVNFSSNVFTTGINHNLSVNDEVTFTKDLGTEFQRLVPYGVAEGTTYYVEEVPATNTFKLAVDSSLSNSVNIKAHPQEFEETIAVTIVASTLYFDGAAAPSLYAIVEQHTYKFDVSDSSNSGKVLAFSTTSDGTHGGGSEYTTGVTRSGTPGTASAYVLFTPPEGFGDIGNFYYYETSTSLSGNDIAPGSLEEISNLFVSKTKIMGSDETVNLHNSTVIKLPPPNDNTGSEMMIAYNPLRTSGIKTFNSNVIIMPENIAYLTSNISASDLTIPISSVSGFSRPNGYAYLSTSNVGVGYSLSNEYVRYTSISGDSLVLEERYNWGPGIVSNFTKDETTVYPMYMIGKCTLDIDEGGSGVQTNTSLIRDPNSLIMPTTCLHINGADYSNFKFKSDGENWFVDGTMITQTSAPMTIDAILSSQYSVREIDYEVIVDEILAATNELIVSQFDYFNGTLFGNYDRVYLTTGSASNNLPGELNLSTYYYINNIESSNIYSFSLSTSIGGSPISLANNKTFSGSDKMRVVKPIIY